MNLREPKKKRRTKLQYRSPFPVNFGEIQEWPIYSAHLTDLGSCVVDPNEINAIHSMGFFGKGSLSRSFPFFGKVQNNVPPIIRHRQWCYRQEWFNQVKDFSTASSMGYLSLMENQYEDITEENNKESCADSKQESKEPESEGTEGLSDITAIYEGPSPANKQETQELAMEDKVKEDEAALEETKDDDIYIVPTETSAQENKSYKEAHPESPRKEEAAESNMDNDLFKNKDSYLLNDQADLESKLLVLPDSDSEVEDYLKNVKPRIEWQSFPIRETLHLTFEETFFLLYGLGCLNLINFDGSLLNINSAWLYFCKRDRYFLQKYIVYHYFRSKGWVVKPGLKYAGEFLLYKQGPPFYHASYIVIIDVVDADTGTRIPSKSMQNISWNSLLGLERLSETAAKEILFAQILWPSTVPQNISPLNPDVLSEFSVREVLWRRWDPRHNKHVLDSEDDDVI